MEAMECYQLQKTFYEASEDLNNWMKCQSTASDMAKVVPRYWQAFMDVASEKVATLVNLGQALLENEELDDGQRKALENKILGARHFEESLTPTGLN